MRACEEIIRGVLNIGGIKLPDDKSERSSISIAQLRQLVADGGLDG